MILLGNLAALSPDTMADSGSHVRARVTALLIRQFTALSLLGSTTTVDHRELHRRLMAEVTRQSEVCLRRYRRFVNTRRVKEPDIDLKLLRVGAVGIATHLKRGEYSLARVLEERVLADEAIDELKHLATRPRQGSRGAVAA